MALDVKSIETKLAALGPAIMELETILADISFMLPAPVAAAIVTLKGFQAAAPTIITDVEKVVADVETAYASFTSGSGSAPVTPAGA